MPFLSQNNSMARRIIVFALVIALGWAFLVVRLFGLQIVENDKYKSIVINQMTKKVSTTAERGKIFDTNMNLLVTNTTVYRVFISPLAIREFEKDSDNGYVVGQAAREIAEKCAEVLGADYDEILEDAAKINRQDETVMKNVSPEKAAVLREFIEEKGFSELLNLAAESKRYYCYGDLACHLIGFTNADGVGV